MRLAYIVAGVLAGTLVTGTAEAQPEPPPHPDLEPEEGDEGKATGEEPPDHPELKEPDSKGAAPEGEGHERPDWGLSPDIETVSPWAPEARGYEKWGEPRDTVSPWPSQPHPRAAGPEIPSGVEARIDVRLGDTSQRIELPPLVRGGIYDRPYLLRIGTDATAVALGGYFDFVAGYERREGIDDGFSFEARRFNLFITSRIADRVRLTSALELQNGTEDIVLETALVDVLLHGAFNIRAGVLLPPIGKFNIAHDAPLYDVVDRPLVSTQIIPATLSEPGAGFFGAIAVGGGNRLTYEIYVTSGLRDGVIAEDGTRLAAGKSSEVFSEDNNGSPAVVGRLAFQSSEAALVQGVLGASAYGGVYNTFRIEGEEVDDARWLRILALDGDLAAGPLRVRGELAYAHVDVPPALTEIHAREQVGAYGEATITFFNRPVWRFERMSLAAVTRIDYVDLNLGNRPPTGEAMGAEHTRLSAGLSLRPAPTTAFRVIYHHDWMTDDLDNSLRGAGFQVGLATYF